MLKDKDQGLELKDRNQGLSTLSAFIKQQTRNHLKGHVLLGFCAPMLLSSRVHWSAEHNYINVI